jgi:hypothetical protein
MLIRGTAVASVLVLGLASGCGLFSDDKPAPPVEDKCVGQTAAGAERIIQAGPGVLPGGGSAVLIEVQIDATPPTADIALGGVDPGEAGRAGVKVGDVVTVKAKKYTVVQICTTNVDLLLQR